MKNKFENEWIQNHFNPKFENSFLFWAEWGQLFKFIETYANSFSQNKNYSKSIELFKKILSHFPENLSVLRNLKIIGIFTRLALRDNKTKYLKLIPYAWEMINYRMSQNKVFGNLNYLLINNFPRFSGK